MLPVASQIQPCFFRFFTLLLSLSFLASFGGNQCALALYPTVGPDEAYPPLDLDHDVSDYPADSVIQESLSRTPQSTILLMAMSQRYFDNYKLYCTSPFKSAKSPWKPLMCLPKAFPKGFLYRRGRSPRWFKDFLARCNAAYMNGARGTVYVLTDEARVPRDCNHFNDLVHTLVQNLNVDRIILVDPADWDVQYEFFNRHKDYEKSDDTNSGDTFEIHPFDTAAISSVALGGYIGTLPAAANVINAFISSNIDPDWRSLLGNEKDQDPAEKNPGEKTDVLDLPIASLPPSDHQPVRAASEITSQTDDIPEIGDGFKTDDQIATNENPDFTNLIRRRRRALLPRDNEDCMGWLGADIFDGLSLDADPSQSDGSSPPNPVAGTSNADTAAAEWNIGKFNVFAKEDVYTLKVTQHRNNPPTPGNYELDISVLDPQGKQVLYQQNDARAGKEIPISVPWDPHFFITHKSSPVFVTTGKSDDDPIEIRYSDLALIGNEENRGMKFDSRNPKCTVGAWTDSQREIRCSIVVVGV